MTKADYQSLTLAENLFTRAFAQNPDAEVGALVAKCVKAAKTFDAALASLESAERKPNGKKS